MSSLAVRLARVRSSVSDAIRDAGRDPSEVTTIVVTKFHPASLVRELAELGVTDVGENRHQEAFSKAAELSDVALHWHFIGQLQSNKAALALEYASVIHSLDRASVVRAITKACREADRTVDGFIQVNLTDDPSRGGIPLADVERFAQSVQEDGSIVLRGLMAVAPLDEEPARAFERVVAASERLLTVVSTATDLSIGMSGDFREAILAGATHLRIGSAITGNRSNPG
ncbi:MAG: YggS family pyridoxal phosphate-dependent enzyme [Microbacteriaceae bacterium]